MQTFDTNPIFTVLHEACYAQAFSTDWSAYRILDEYPEFNRMMRFLFTGEMLYPWMLDSYKALKPSFKGAANILAKKNDWPMLYSEENSTGKSSICSLLCCLYK